VFGNIHNNTKIILLRSYNINLLKVDAFCDEWGLLLDMGCHINSYICNESALNRSERTI
jgi:hypothetical protein